MIKLEYKGWMLREAKKKAEKLGSIKNSITKGKGNIAGYLAEIALAKHLGAKNISCKDGKEKYNFDLIFDDKKLECKTKRRTVDPKPEYEVSIAKTSKHQKADVYAFLSVTFKEKRGKGLSVTYHGVDSIWLCGFMTAEEYFKKSKFMPKGKMDFSNGFKTRADMYNLPISELHDDFPSNI